MDSTVKKQRTSMRLDRYLSICSPYPRSGIPGLVRKGAITVNGIPARTVKDRVSTDDRIEVNGVPMLYREFIYLMLNKPQGYLSATEDERDPVVVDLVPEEWKHFSPAPVGRLDKDTEGLLILSNDGQFNHAVTSPRKCVYKRYYAELDAPATPDDVSAFRAGMDLGDFCTAPALLELTDSPDKVLIEIAEGKFHQVKRMCEKIGKHVTYLKRVAIGALQLDSSLALGEIRELTEAEKDMLTVSKTFS